MSPRPAPALLLVAVLALTVTAIASEESEAAPSMVYYCYGNTLELSYLYDESRVTVEWTLEKHFTDGTVRTETDTGSRITVNVVGCSHVNVTQTVRSLTDPTTDSQEIMIYSMGLGPGEEYTVTFMSDSTPYVKRHLDGKWTIILGQPFVQLPSDPVKSGYTFGGWYTDQACTQQFDPYQPVTGDMFVYAKWTASGGQVVTEDGYVVTFDVTDGLKYDVQSVGKDSVKFTVGTKEGHRYKEGTLQVFPSSGFITKDDDSYTLSSIKSNVIVRISAQMLGTVSYDMSNCTISETTASDGSISAKVSPSFGWSGLSIKVLKDGRDVTSEWLSGDTVKVPADSGNVVVIAKATLPWLYILIAAIVVIAIISFLILRRRSE